VLGQLGHGASLPGEDAGMLPKLDVVPLLPPERAALLEVLGATDPERWERPTECPAWTVKGVALHVLGDDLSLLSRQRDGAVNGIVLEALRPGAPADFRALLDCFNERWVDTAAFFGTRLVGELLELTGDLTAHFYGGVDPDLIGEPVGLFGGDPAPYWQIAAREYLERWVHQAQIRRALDAPALEDPALVVPGCGVVARALVQALAVVEAPTGAAVVLALDGDEGAWTYTREEGGWALTDGAAGDPAARLLVPLPDAALVFTRGLPADEVRLRITVAGDPAVAEPVVDRLALVAGRSG
jgi:uncharacterized protein (TIGR03083 family)